MDERRLQCEFFIPIVRDSDKKPHQAVACNLLVNEIRRVFPAGHSGPETFYRGDSLVPGEYEPAPGVPPIADTSRRYILAVADSKVSDLRSMLRMAAHTFDQQAIYLSVAGAVEFIVPTEEDGFL
ncbi:MAG: hypothetical protein U0793_16105 [Gemmataceae bacterium]